MTSQGLTENLNLSHTLAELTRFLHLCCKPLCPCNSDFCMSTQHHIGIPGKFCCLLEIDTLWPSYTKLHWPLCTLQLAQENTSKGSCWARNPFSCVPVQSLFKCIHNSPQSQGRVWGFLTVILVSLMIMSASVCKLAHVFLSSHYASDWQQWAVTMVQTKSSCLESSFTKQMSPLPSTLSSLRFSEHGQNEPELDKGDFCLNSQ